MKLSLTADQTELQHSLRQLFGKECPVDLVRSLRHPDPGPFPAQLWRALAGAGVLGLPFDTEIGGQGGALFELGLAYQEAGRVLCPTALYSSMAFGLAVDRLCNGEQRGRLLGRLVEGELRGCAALWHHSGDLDRHPVRARRVGGRWRLDGRVEFMPNLDSAELLMLSATVTDATEPDRTLVVLLAVPTPAAEVRRHKTFARDSQFSMDLTGCLVDDDAVVTVGLGEGVLRWLRNAGTALQCMEMVGGAQAVLDRTVDYVMTREQFGRPIAGFQAAQHMVADVRLAVDGARLTACQALWWLTEGETADRPTAIAKAKCNDAYKRATLTAHQLHGGMGYLRETDLHLWSERAKTTELTGGAFDVQMRRLAQALQIGAS